MNSEVEEKQKYNEWVMDLPMSWPEHQDLGWRAWQHQQAKIDKLKREKQALKLELIRALTDSENYGFGEK